MFVHLLTFLMAWKFLRYGINFRGNGGVEKTLRIKLDIWPNTRGISLPLSDICNWNKKKIKNEHYVCKFCYT